MFSHPPTRRAMLIASLILTFANLAVYGRVVGFSFLSLDDDRYVTANAAVLGGLSRSSLIWAFTSFHASNWHPLTWLSHMLDCALFGTGAGGHHAVSLVIHVAATLVLFLLWTRITGALVPSFILAALFSLHPLRVESVAWIAERKDVLGMLFWSLTLWAYCMYAYRRRNRAPHRSSSSDLRVIRQAKAAGRPANILAPGEASENGHGAARLWYGAALALFTLGLLAKPMLVSLPLILLLLDLWPLQRLGSIPPGRLLPSNLPRLLMEKAPFVVLAAASCLITLAAQSAGGAVKSLDAVPLPARVGNAVVAVPRYLGLMIWPSGLTVHYRYALHLPAWQIAASAVFLVVLTCLAALPVAAYFRRSRTREGLTTADENEPPARQTFPRGASDIADENEPSAGDGAARIELPPPPYAELLVGWAWFLITLFPVIGIVQVGSQSVADRYTYIPSIGVLVACVFGGYRYLVGRPRALRAAECAALLMIVLYAAAAWRQTGYWRNNLTLFAHGVDVEPTDAMSHLHLARALEDGGRRDDAIREYRELLRLQPSVRSGHYFLGLALEDSGRTEEGEAELRQELAWHPDHAQARCALGRALGRRGKLNEALDQFDRATLIDPSYQVAWYNKGTALEDLGRLKEAAAAYAHAAALDPSDEDARNRMRSLQNRLPPGG